MDNQHREHKHSYKISIQSRKSNLSSCRSLQRPSWGSNHKSLSKNHSLVEVMSLQSGRKSDIYDKMLEESIKPKLFRQSQGGMIQGNIYQAYNYQKGDNYYQPPKGYYQRKSEEQNITINHTCTCYTQCQWQNCPCFEAKTQLCIKGYCCVGCIENKEKVLNNQLIQANSQGIQKEHMFCTCKKTKCNKKYCSCFAAGVLCGQKCSCQGCLNCLKSANEGMQIEEMQQQIDLQELNRMAMPSGIQFQPVQFRFSNPEG